MKRFNLNLQDLEVQQIAREFCGRPHLWIDIKIWFAKKIK